MASIVGLNHLGEALIDAGNRLLTPHSSTDELLNLLDVRLPLLILPIKIVSFVRLDSSKCD